MGTENNQSGIQYEKEWYKKNGKDVVILPRTEGVSSSTLREYLKDK